MANARKTIKNIGKGLVYATTGFLPSRCQNYLAEKFEWYNPDHATFTSFVTEGIAADIALALNPYNPVYLVPLLDFGCRGFVAVYKHLKKPYPTPSVGTLLLEIPALPVGRIYDRVTQKNNNGIDTGLALRNNNLERFLYSQ